MLVIKQKHKNSWLKKTLNLILAFSRMKNLKLKASYDEMIEEQYLKIFAIKPFFFLFREV